jgi:hypothetical protein
LIVCGDEEQLDAAVSDEERAGYSGLLIRLFTDDEWSAYRVVEDAVSSSKDPEPTRLFSAEIAIVTARCGNEAESRAALEAWSADTPTADRKAIEAFLLRRAHARGWLQEAPAHPALGAGS